MKLRVINTGSSGNCYILDCGNKGKVILDCGVDMKQIMKAIDYDVKSVKGVFTSHSHLDHCLSKSHLEAMGLNVIAPYCYPMAGGFFGGWSWHCFELPHNGTKNYGFVIQVDDKTILYLTDFEYCPYTFKNYKPDYIIVECNYQKEFLSKDLANLEHKVKGHCELGTTKDFILANKTEKLKDIVVIHHSNTTCNKDEIKDVLAKESNCLVHIAEPGMDIELTADVPF